MTALLLALAISHRFVIPVAYSNTAVAQAAFGQNSMLMSTGLADYPVVEIRILNADLVGIPWNPAHAREFPLSRMLNAMMFMKNTSARAKGMVTTPDNTVIVWWVD